MTAILILQYIGRVVCGLSLLWADLLCWYMVLLVLLTRISETNTAHFNVEKIYWRHLVASVAISVLLCTSIAICKVCLSSIQITRHLSGQFARFVFLQFKSLDICLVKMKFTMLFFVVSACNCCNIFRNTLLYLVLSEKLYFCCTLVRCSTIAGLYLICHLCFLINKKTVFNNMGINLSIDCFSLANLNLLTFRHT